MKTILIPTDFSDNAWHAIAYAMNFFKDEPCTFYLLHTYSPAFYRMDYVFGGPSFSAIPDVGVDISLMGLEKTLEDIKKVYDNPRHQFELVSSFNTLTDEVEDLVGSRGIDLVVMGTKGASGAKELFLGSNTVFVIRKGKAPVMAIPEQVKYHPVRNILFPSDYLNRYKPEDLLPILKIARMHQARFTLLHVNEEGGLTLEQKDNKAHLERHLEELEYETVELEGQLMPDAVLAYIEEHPVDLLVMMNRRHSFFERLLLRQNVDQIGFHVRIPFLVVPDTSTTR
ncbi:universal stress protein [Robiginitalea marina]|jgi:nucleotide-binding universal stress UspA family protein|uniref:Universal stress protein n=1 Tax=Robiginitalea marina TaxID=2954105 RepID=A0ABT1AYP4_9FLAO|nr:universal stress protein [Robiginitalea marina]MCO5725163.1 universal stress protein [Robiginitalea marina]